MRKRLLNLCLTALMSVVSTAAWALSDVNGVYQISSAEDWNEFAALVNDGAVTANAVLTADIDLGMNVTMVGINDNNGAVPAYAMTIGDGVDFLTAMADNLGFRYDSDGDGQDENY